MKEDGVLFYCLVLLDLIKLWGIVFLFYWEENYGNDLEIYFLFFFVKILDVEWIWSVKSVIFYLVKVFRVLFLNFLVVLGWKLFCLFLNLGWYFFRCFIFFFVKFIFMVVVVIFVVFFVIIKLWFVYLFGIVRRFLYWGLLLVYFGDV